MSQRPVFGFPIFGSGHDVQRPWSFARQQSRAIDVRRTWPQLNSVCPRVRAMRNLVDWTHITTGFEGRAVNGSFAVEDGMVIVKSSRGYERKSQIEEGANSISTAVHLQRDLAAAGKA